MCNEREREREPIMWNEWNEWNESNDFNDCNECNEWNECSDANISIAGVHDEFPNPIFPSLQPIISTSRAHYLPQYFHLFPSPQTILSTGAHYLPQYYHL